MFNWFWEFLYGLIKVPLFCIDVIMLVARKLCGIDNIQVEKTVNGELITEDIDLLSYFLEGETVMDALGYVCLFGFILLLLFTAFRVLRDQANFYEKKSPVRICIDSAKIILFFLLVPAIMIAATAFVSTIMRGIYAATANGNSGLGGSMFVVFAEEAYIGPAEDKQAILDAFRTCSLEDYLMGVSDFSYYNASKVTSYFKLSKINFFLGFVGSIAVVVLLGLTLLSFVERIISLVLLFVIAPLPMSVAPLDDGERFKLWREQTINKFITAYGGILALNIFALMLPLIANVNFFPGQGDFVSVVNGIARLLFIIGGAFACRRGMVLIGNLVARGAGSQDLMDQSHLSGGMASLARMAGGVVKGVFNMAGGAFNTGRSWVRAAGIPTSIEEGIRYTTQKKQEAKAQERAREAAEKSNRFDGKVDRGNSQNTANLQAAMKGKTEAGGGADDKKSGQGSTENTVAHKEKNSELNKSAQNDIKAALQNKKNGDEKESKESGSSGSKQ